jgi:hypothetical protein
VTSSSDAIGAVARSSSMAGVLAMLGSVMSDERGGERTSEESNARNHNS